VALMRTGETRTGFWKPEGKIATRQDLGIDGKTLKRTFKKEDECGRGGLH